MDRYCVIMFVTSEQETAIKNLFLQNDWVFHCKGIYTLQPLYNTVRYNTVVDITQFKVRSQKCIDYIEK